MSLKESAMSEPISEWLTFRGYVPYAEIKPLGAVAGANIDMVGWDKDADLLIAVEMKKNLTKGVIHQGFGNIYRVNESYCAVFSDPREKGLKLCRELGLGVLRVDNGVVIEVLSARVQAPSNNGKEALTGMLKRVDPGGTGGLPSTKGMGPAQDVERRILEYREEHPNATWKEMFANISNHYVSYNTMRCAMNSLQMRRKQNEYVKRFKEVQRLRQKDRARGATPFKAEEFNNGTR